MDVLPEFQDAPVGVVEVMVPRGLLDRARAELGYGSDDSMVLSLVTDAVRRAREIRR